MRILDVQKHINDQYEKFRVRRTSQFLRFLDKNVDFVTYYNINKRLSTGELGNHTIDSYIGKDSPIRYNKISNLPVYGIANIQDMNDFDQDSGGFTGEGYSGDLIMLPNILEPLEGDCFVIDYFNRNIFFIVDEVTQIVLKAEPHYHVKFHIGIPEYIYQLENQVVESYHAIFDNIGTQDKVIVSDKNYNLAAEYMAIYKDMHDYYIAKFFNKRETLFMIKNRSYPCLKEDEDFVDRYLIKFMIDNRIIIFDNLLKTTLTIDNNSIFNSNYIYLEYRKSLYSAIEHRSIQNLIPASYLSIIQIDSPFSLRHGRHDEMLTVSSYYSVEKPEENKWKIPLNYADIINRVQQRDIHTSDDIYDHIMSIIVKYMHKSIIAPGYFNNFIDSIDNELDEYMYLPIILYIIRDQYNGILKRTKKFSEI